MTELPKPRCRTCLFIVLALLAAGGVTGASWFHRNFRTPASTEPPPPNVSFKKWEKTSALEVRLEPTEWERRLGRNLHHAAYQAATNLVRQTLAKPETAHFKPFRKAKITGVDAHFLVKGNYEAVNKSGETRQYGYHIYLKRETNEVWTIEYLDKDKEDVVTKGLKKTADKKDKAAE